MNDRRKDNLFVQKISSVLISNRNFNCFLYLTTDFKSAGNRRPSEKLMLTKDDSNQSADHRQKKKEVDIWCHI